MASWSSLSAMRELHVMNMSLKGHQKEGDRNTNLTRSSVSRAKASASISDSSLSISLLVYSRFGLPVICSQISNLPLSRCLFGGGGDSDRLNERRRFIFCGAAFAEMDDCDPDKVAMVGLLLVLYIFSAACEEDDALSVDVVRRGGSDGLEAVGFVEEGLEIAADVEI